jgi:hypothetical protein
MRTFPAPNHPGVFVATVLFLATTLACAGGSPDPLWQKALAIAQTNAGWVAGLIVTRSEVVYKRETNGVHEIWRRSTLGKDGEVVTSTVKVLEEGKDVTEQESKNEKGKKGKTKKGAEQGLGNPFAIEIQPRLFLTLTNRSRTIAGQDCLGYLFEVRNTNALKTRGVAWLQRETGTPAELENVTLTPLPDKHLKALTITTHYESTADGAWRAREMRTTGKVSRFFINADFQSTTTFSEYWKMPARKGAEGKDGK